MRPVLRSPHRNQVSRPRPAHKKEGAEPEPSTAPRPKGSRNSIQPTPPYRGRGPDAASVNRKSPFPITGKEAQVGRLLWSST
jgi:hypothetical protein